jgi:hypothetical protein
MIIAFLVYLFFSYYFISKKVVNLCSLSLLYILLGIYVGESTIKFSAQWVRLNDLSFFNESVTFLKNPIKVFKNIKETVYYKFLKMLLLIHY